MHLPNDQRVGTPRCGVPRPRAAGGTDCSARRLGRVIDWTAGCAIPGSPSPHPSPLGRGRMVHRLSITPMPELDQPQPAKHQTAGCCSLSLRERVRVRGNSPVAHPNRKISQSLLCKAPLNAVRIAESAVPTSLNAYGLESPVNRLAGKPAPLSGLYSL